MDDKKKKMLRRRMIATFFAVLFLGLAIGSLFVPAFKLQEVWCEGNSILPQEEIVAAAQTVIGKNIILQSTASIRRRVEKLPMIENAKVDRVFPNKFKITVTERIPAAYMNFDGGLAVVDTEGRVLDVLTDERVGIITELYTPKFATEPSENQKDGDKKGAEEGNTEKDKGADENDDEKTENNQNPEGEPATDASVENIFPIPLVTGADINKAEAGKTAESKEKEKLATLLEMFGSLNKSGLLSRATYIDITNINDVKLVIENRLDIQIGQPVNLEYRCAFLAKVINEKISRAEQAALDYRTDDIYVRPPEDGKARRVPDEPKTPADENGDNNKEENGEKTGDKNKNGDTDNAEQDGDKTKTQNLPPMSPSVQDEAKSEEE